MPDNVIELKTGKSLQEKAKEEHEERQKQDELVRQERQENQERILKILDDLRATFERGDMDDLILVATHRPTGLVYSELIFLPDTNRPAKSAQVLGVLEMIKTEMLDIAMCAPEVSVNGEIIMMDEGYPEDEEHF